MTIYEDSWRLADLLELNQVVYLKAEPEIPDFTDGSSFKLVVWGSRQNVEIEVNPQNAILVAGLLDATIFDSAQVRNLYAWNIKSIISYFKFYVTKFVTPANSVIDLKPIEYFLGIRKNVPQNLTEVVNRVKAVLGNKDWQAIYKKIHMPLSLRVLPAIETAGLLNEATRRAEYPYYEIEGQSNGRMNCLKKYSSSFLPHTMGPDVTKTLKPLGGTGRFLVCDFRHCEVSVLQWLTQDEKLKDVLSSGVDLHCSIYEMVTGDPCNTDVKRTLSKKMFLPVVYGCGVKGLASLTGLTEAVCKELIGRMHATFPETFDWISNKQEEARSGAIKDYFGRVRLFEPNEVYKARNFVVQAVAATVCQERMIELYKALNDTLAYIVFSVHDGYGVVLDTSEALETYHMVKKSLETESVLCSGLSLKVESKVGIKLSDLQVVGKNKSY